MTVIFFIMHLKFNAGFRNAEKNSAKVFCFKDNSINVCTNSLKSLHSTKIDFFQLNYVHSDQ